MCIESLLAYHHMWWIASTSSKKMKIICKTIIFNKLLWFCLNIKIARVIRHGRQCSNKTLLLECGSSLVTYAVNTSHTLHLFLQFTSPNKETIKYCVMCPVLFVSISANITSASFEHRMNVTKKSYLRVDQHVRLADKNFNNFNRMKVRLIE